MRQTIFNRDALKDLDHHNSAKLEYLFDDEGVSLMRHEGSNASTQSSEGSEDEDSLISINQTKKSMVLKEIMQKQQSLLWDSKRDQAILEICSNHETNLFKLEGLIAFRAICFLILSWLVYSDLKLKEESHVIEKYSFVCEVLALIVFFLLTAQSLLKYEKYINNMDFQNSNKEEKMASEILETTSLTKLSAFMFEWAVIC